MTPSQSTALLPTQARAVIFSRDLYELLMNMQNGIHTLADKAMANSVIVRLDCAREAVLKAEADSVAAASTRGMEKEGPSPLEDLGALGYAARLADALWRKYYQQEAPNWQPFDDLLGVLTQIDNMVAGLTKKAAQATPHTDHPARDPAQPFTEPGQRRWSRVMEVMDEAMQRAVRAFEIGTAEDYSKACVAFDDALSAELDRTHGVEDASVHGMEALTDTQIKAGLAAANSMDSAFDYGDGSTAAEREAASVDAFRRAAAAPAPQGMEAQNARIRDALRAMQEMWDHLRRKGLNEILMREYSDALKVLEADFTERLSAAGAPAKQSTPTKEKENGNG